MNMKGKWDVSKKYEYALYKGDNFIDLGTKEYLAKLIGVTQKTIGWLASPSARKRRRKGENSNSLICVRIDIDKDE